MNVAWSYGVCTCVLFETNLINHLKLLHKWQRSREKDRQTVDIYVLNRRTVTSDTQTHYYSTIVLTAAEANGSKLVGVLIN